MKLGSEAGQKIRGRVEPLLTELDADLALLEVLLDSTRRYLGLVVQKGDRPMILKLEWINYITLKDAELKENLAKQLREKIPGSSVKTPTPA